MSLPDHVRRHLEATGVLTADGFSRRARLHPCRACAQPVVSGLDANVCALTGHADPHPLTASGEVAALLDGRTTYELTDRVDRSELDARDTWDIRARPAGGDPPVLAEHRCRQPIPADWQATTSRTPAPPDSADPPF